MIELTNIPLFLVSLFFMFIILDGVWTSVIATKRHAKLLEGMNLQGSRPYLTSLMVLSCGVAAIPFYYMGGLSNDEVQLLIAIPAFVYVCISFMPSPTLFGNILGIN